MCRILLNLLCLMAPAVAMGARVPDNVVITEAKEVYTFVETPRGLEVKTVEQTRYEATRHSARVVPAAFYCDVISLDKASGGKPHYREVNSPNVFHDDSRICLLDIELKAKGATGKSEFRRTYKDAAYFTTVYIADSDYPIREKVIRFDVPASRPDIEFVECNFPDSGVIRNESVNPDGSRSVMFYITGLPELSDDESAPAALARWPYIFVKGYFRNPRELHDYHRRLLDVDTVIPDLSAVLAEATSGAVSRDSIVTGIYRYVQQKIRYVAFEEGEAGWRPDAPAEVLRKRYGDCKGMALLLATLLNRAGVDAHIACIGTRRIPFGISDLPSLSATNHMICIAPAPGDTLVLDATYEYISPCDIPAGIQGKDAMMFTPDGYEMIHIPVRGPETSSGVSVYEYAVDGSSLAGSASVRLTGEMLEVYVSSVSGTNRTYKDDVLAMMLRPRRNTKVDKESLAGGYLSDGEYEFTATMTDDAAVTDVGDAMYVDLATGGGYFIGRVDLTDRRDDLELPFRSSIVKKAVLRIPDGYRVGELPPDFHGECCGVAMDCRYSIGDDGCVTAEKSVTVRETRIPLAEIGQWNSLVSAWNEAAAHQIELLKL